MPEKSLESGCPDCGQAYGHSSDCPKIFQMQENIKKGRLKERDEAETADWRTQEVIENEEARELFLNTILTAQLSEDKFPTSTKENNQDIGYDTRVAQGNFVKVLPPYSWSPPKTARNFWGGDANIGHKLHLNVPLNSVKTVSRHLKLLGVEHKYLSGGEVDDGKIFTVYCGSKNRADMIAQQISRDLAHDLRRPLAVSEAEYAPNVCGRFVGSLAEWSQYPKGKMRGITPLAGDPEKELLFPTIFKQLPGTEQERVSRMALRRSFELAASKYGKYFYGSGNKSAK
jgi:hypothetical protein